MNTQNLSDLNKIYPLQNTILLCKIFENHATEMSV